MTNKVNGFAKAAESLTGNLDFFTVTTSTEIRPSETGGQANLDRLVEIISTVAQPVILGSVARVSTNNVIKFAIEHTEAWGADGANLKAAMEANSKFAGVTVVRSNEV